MVWYLWHWAMTTICCSQEQHDVVRMTRLPDVWFSAKDTTLFVTQWSHSVFSATLWGLCHCIALHCIPGSAGWRDACSDHLIPPPPPCSWARPGLDQQWAGLPLLWWVQWPFILGRRCTIYPLPVQTTGTARARPSRTRSTKKGIGVNTACQGSDILACCVRV